MSLSPADCAASDERRLKLKFAGVRIMAVADDRLCANVACATVACGAVVCCCVLYGCSRALSLHQRAHYMYLRAQILFSFSFFVFRFKVKRCKVNTVKRYYTLRLKVIIQSLRLPFSGIM